MYTIRSILREGRDRLKEISDTAALDVAVLLCDQLGVNRIKIISSSDDQVSDETAELFFRNVERRKSNEPVAYITGKKEFYGLEFLVTPDVLIPRPETELLVETALKFLETRNQELSILDLGTGSGCIAVSLAAELKKLNKKFIIDAVDVSGDALKVAGQNAAKHSISEISFRESNWYSEVNAEYDLIVSNPPYIASDDKDVSPEIAFEPASALYSEAQGLSDIEAIIKGSPGHIKENGMLLIEMGYTQGSQAEILAKKYLPLLQCKVHKDIAGKDRLIQIS